MINALMYRMNMNVLLQFFKVYLPLLPTIWFYRKSIDYEKYFEANFFLTEDPACIKSISHKLLLNFKIFFF